MNYPCIKCIVEYLEANRRLRLSSRCPAIRKIERSIPLHLELLHITTESIVINGYRFTSEKEWVGEGEVVLPGDIFLENYGRSVEGRYYWQVLWANNEIDPTGMIFNDEVLKIFPEGVKLHHAMRWLGNFLFEGRSEITTSILDIAHAKVLRLPVDFKIKITEVLVAKMHFLDQISQLVHPMVETICFSSDDRQTIQDHPLIRTARKIEIYFEVHISDLLDFTHKNIEYGETLSKENFEKLIRKWITDGKEVGTSFTFYSNHEDSSMNSLKHFEIMFAGRAVYHMGQSEHLNTQDLYSRLKVLMKSHELYEARNILDCLCLPMHNSTSELQISVSKGHHLHYPIKIVLEVVPFAFWPTVTTAKSDHVDKKTKNDMCKVS